MTNPPSGRILTFFAKLRARPRTSRFHRRILVFGPDPNESRRVIALLQGSLTPVPVPKASDDFLAVSGTRRWRIRLLTDPNAPPETDDRFDPDTLIGCLPRQAQDEAWAFFLANRIATERSEGRLRRACVVLTGVEAATGPRHVSQASLEVPRNQDPGAWLAEQLNDRADDEGHPLADPDWRRFLQRTFANGSLTRTLQHASSAINRALPVFFLHEKNEAQPAKEPLRNWVAQGRVARTAQSHRRLGWALRATVAAGLLLFLLGWRLPEAAQTPRAGTLSGRVRAVGIDIDSRIGSYDRLSVIVASWLRSTSHLNELKRTQDVLRGPIVTANLIGDMAAKVVEASAMHRGQDKTPEDKRQEERSKQAASLIATALASKAQAEEQSVGALCGELRSQLDELLVATLLTTAQVEPDGRSTGTLRWDDDTRRETQAIFPASSSIPEVLAVGELSDLYRRVAGYAELHSQLPKPNIGSFVSLARRPIESTADIQAMNRSIQAFREMIVESKGADNEALKALEVQTAAFLSEREMKLEFRPRQPGGWHLHWLPLQASQPENASDEGGHVTTSITRAPGARVEMMLSPESAQHMRFPGQDCRGGVPTSISLDRKTQMIGVAGRQFDVTVLNWPEWPAKD